MKILYIVLTAIAAIAACLTVSGCTTQHRVTQSSYNTSTGDSIVIKYEQWGTMKKK